VPGGPWLKAVTEALQAAGNRLTSPRRAVLRWIAESSAPFTAETLTHELAPQLATGSRATIYRLLQWLRVEGWLARIHNSDRTHALVRQLPGHHQAICLGCGTTLLLGGCDLAPVVSPSLRDTGFTIESHLLEVYGWCGPCRDSRAQAPVTA
jgi:Fur family ferric uptake transcriptional regulator